MTVVPSSNSCRRPPAVTTCRLRDAELAMARPFPVIMRLTG
jgi:hypothetical protein